MNQVTGFSINATVLCLELSIFERAILFSLGIAYSFSLGFLILIVFLTYKKAKSFQLYERRVSKLERELIPSPGLIIGWNPRPSSGSLEEDLSTMYDTIPSYYKNSLSSMETEYRRSSLCERPIAVLLQNLAEAPLCTVPDSQSSDIETIMKILFSARNSHFMKNNSRKEVRNSFDASSRVPNYSPTTSLSEMYHGQRRNTMASLQVVRRKSSQFLTMREQMFNGYPWQVNYGREIQRILRMRQRRVAVSFHSPTNFIRYNDDQQAQIIEEDQEQQLRRRHLGHQD